MLTKSGEFLDLLTIGLIVVSLCVVAMYVFYPLLLWIISSSSRSAKKVLHKRNFTPSLSVIVATYNEESVIQKKLEELLETTYPKNLLEIIVVDSGSTDGTREAVREFQEKGVILIEQTERLGKASALNQALSEARGEIIVLSDANSEFQPDSLKEILTYFDDETGAVLPRFVPNGVLSFWDKIFYSFHHMYKMLESRTDSVFIVFGELFVFRKGLITKINEKTAADDLDIAMAIRRKQYKIKYAPTVTVKEKIPSNSKDVRVQKTRHIFGILEVMMRNIDLFGNSNFGYYGRLIFPTHLIQLTIGPFLVFAAVLLFAVKLFVVLVGILNPFMLLALFAICIVALTSVVLIRSTRKLFSSFYGFLTVQIYILLALLNIARKKQDFAWEKISSTR